MLSNKYTPLRKLKIAFILLFFNISINFAQLPVRHDGIYYYVNKTKGHEYKGDKEFFKGISNLLKLQGVIPDTNLILKIPKCTEDSMLVFQENDSSEFMHIFFFVNDTIALESHYNCNEFSFLKLKTIEMLCYHYNLINGSQKASPYKITKAGNNLQMINEPYNPNALVSIFYVRIIDNDEIEIKGEWLMRINQVKMENNQFKDYKTYNFISFNELFGNP